MGRTFQKYLEVKKAITCAVWSLDCMENSEEENVREPTQAEVEKTIKSLKNRKSPGESGIEEGERKCVKLCEWVHKKDLEGRVKPNEWVQR